MLVQDEAVEDGQHLFTVLVDALEVLAEIGLEIGGTHPLINHAAGDVDVLAKGVDIVAPEEESVKESRFPLGG